MNTTREDALEQVGIYLSWVPPRHAKAAREALARVAAEVERLEDLAVYHADLHGRAAKDARAQFVRAETAERELARLRDGLRRIDHEAEYGVGGYIAILVRISNMARALLSASQDTKETA